MYCHYIGWCNGNCPLYRGVLHWRLYTNLGISGQAVTYTLLSGFVKVHFREHDEVGLQNRLLGGAHRDVFGGGETVPA